MQRENERIIYHLMHFNKKDKEWSERPYLLLEDMAIVLIFLIWMIDPYKESIIKRQTKNNGRISFYGRVQRRIQNSFCLLNLSLYIKISEDIPKTDRYLWCQTKYRDMEQLLFVMNIFWMIFLENITRVCISCQPVFMKCYYCLMTEKIRKRIYCTY